MTQRGGEQVFTLPNGVLIEYGHDAASRVTSITYKQNGTTVIGDLTYEYDKAGNRTKIGGSWARTGMPEPLTATSYDASNRQLTFGDKTLAYDDNGNLQSITDSNGTTLYSWNARNQLVGISGPNVNASFVYDGLGRRKAKTINGSLTEFLYDGVNPVQETAGATILANIAPGLRIDEFQTRTDVVAGVTTSFLTDVLGSPIALADSAGVVQTEYTYESFGRTVATGASNSSSYQYTGRENEGTGFYYYRARFYDPVLHRFIGEDPLDIWGGDINLYGFVLSNPLKFIDPLGLDLTVALYPGAGGFGHVGMGVNSPATFGFYPAEGASPFGTATGQPVPGAMHPDTRAPVDSVTIPTNSRQDEAVQRFINDRIRNPGIYDLNGRNCATTVIDALRQAQIYTPQTILPRTLMGNLKQQFGPGVNLEN